MDYSPLFFKVGANKIKRLCMNKLFLLAMLVAAVSTAQAAQNSGDQARIEKIKAKGMNALNNAEYCNYVRIPAAATFLGLCGAGVVLRRLPFSTLTKVATVAEYTAGFAHLFAAVGYFDNLRTAKECVTTIKCLEKMDTLRAYP